MLGKIVGWIVTKVATAFGFADPVKLFAQIQLFSQPSEVAFPIELLNFGFSIHTRGMVNYCAIQHNMDWLWPYWAQRQFNPNDISFVPRAFTMTHINLTYRNWTALGVPGYGNYPLVDPRGLVTPYYDSWSVDAWIVTEKDAKEKAPDDLIPSRKIEAKQELLFEPFLKVRTSSAEKDAKLISESWVERKDESSAPFLRIKFQASAEKKCWLAVVLRPYNPEGVSLVRKVEILPDKKGWRINKKDALNFEQPWDAHAFSCYHEGDVYRKLPAADTLEKMDCPVGLATAAALYEIMPGSTREVSMNMPLEKTEQPGAPDAAANTGALWREHIGSAPRPSVPDAHFRFLYEASLHTAVLHSPREIFPGPFTYKHFWFRDAALISYALICAGLPERVEKVIDAFLSRQKKNGYFHSQDGEWDSNGQVLWIMQKYCQLTGIVPKPEWKKHIVDGAHWIKKKRIRNNPDSPHYGLFPAGFSAEYLGPNDFYYWDDFWGVQGLDAAVWLLEKYGDAKDVKEFKEESAAFLQDIEQSFKKNRYCQKGPAMPASPYRRLDSGSIGSLAAGYPLKLWAENDPRLVETINYLVENCFVKGVFFQDIAHAGMNPYLTLHMAQNMMRAGDPRAFDAVKSIASFATAAGQWPEAVHPQTLGGCMGDGQHAWASAEWLMMIRNMFVREEEGTLILCSGIPREWLESNQKLRWGPAPTEFGLVEVTVQSLEGNVTVEWTGKWHSTVPKVEIRFPGQETITVQTGQTRVSLSELQKAGK